MTEVDRIRCIWIAASIFKTIKLVSGESVSGIPAKNYDDAAFTNLFKFNYNKIIIKIELLQLCKHIRYTYGCVQNLLCCKYYCRCYSRFDDFLYYEIEKLKSGWHCPIMDNIIISSNNLCKVYIKIKKLYSR